MKQFKVLCISTYRWPFTARMPMALAKAGFAVAAVAPNNGPISVIRSLRARFPFRRWMPLKSVEKAIAAWEPDLLVCSDDRAVRTLHRLHRRAKANGHRRVSRRLVNLIEASLGEPEAYAAAQSMSSFILSAQTNGVRTPATTIVGNNKDLKASRASICYPVLLKADGSQGGRGIRVVKNESMLAKAASELLLPISWPAPIKRLIAGRLAFSVWACRRSWSRKLCLQEYINGQPANRAVVCWKGRVLAGISVRAVETAYAFGPVSVVGIIDNTKMEYSVQAMAAQLKLSGFIGFDFVLDDEGHAWLLEMNPRVTPVAHLGRAGADLADAIYGQFAGRGLPEVSAPDEPTIALFPQELARTSRSEHLNNTWHDVPWDEPEFVRYCLNYVAKKSLLTRCRARWHTPPGSTSVEGAVRKTESVEGEKCRTM